MQYIYVSDVVNALAVVRKDDSRQEFLRHMIVAKEVLKELKIIYINDFKRVFIPIDPKTMTVRIPLDYQRYRTISVMQKCKDAFGRDVEKPIPLTYNPYINITPLEKNKNACQICGCEPTHPVCVELDAYTTLCEEVVLDDGVTIGTKQTVLKTCPNGDIISEITQPTLKFKKGDQKCDYDIAVDTSYRICSYVADWKSLFSSVHFPITISLTINGFTVTSGSLANATALDNYILSLGWTKVVSLSYTYEDANSYGDSASIRDNINQHYSMPITGSCEDVIFPYTILSIKINGAEQTESPPIEIANQSEQDAFFADMGFTKVDATHYHLENSEDVYYNIVITDSNSPATETTINFTQSGCYYPMVSDGITNSVTTDVLCNVDVKACGCIEESASNIDTIVSCCAPFLNCCQQGELNNWQGWGYVPSCCPTPTHQPYNLKGTYNIDEKNLIIYLDSVNATRILLSYDTDGSCEGNYAIPDYYLTAFKAGIAAYAAEFDEQISEPRRASLFRNFEKRLTELSKRWTDPIRMIDLVGATKTRLTPY